MIESVKLRILVMGESMKKKQILKIDKTLLFILLILEMISILTIKSAEKLLPSYMQDLAIKQFFWYSIGFLFIFFIVRYGTKSLYKNVWFLYFFMNGLLLILLFFGTPVNDAKCWFQIPGIGSFQPSEFMKIVLILTEAITIQEFYKKYRNPTYKQEFFFLLKIAGIVFLPSVLTFLEPDTGVVLIYLLITFVMLFIGGIRYQWFLGLAITVSIFLSFFIFLYLWNQLEFIEIFGTSFFLRMDRLLDWSRKTGYQLENGLASIGAGGIFGTGLFHTPIYFPEPQTDFIFAVYASNFGFLGSCFLIMLLFFFDSHIIGIAKNTKNYIHKYVISGIIGMLIYQQIQNIGMTFGLMPITGITLPFISYGGSSLFSYMLMMGIVFSIEKETRHYKN